MRLLRPQLKKWRGLKLLPEMQTMIPMGRKRRRQRRSWRRRKRKVEPPHLPHPPSSNNSNRKMSNLQFSML